MFFRGPIVASFLIVAAAAINVVAAQDDIPSVAVAAGSFETLVTALDVANLVGTLSEPNGPFTVFAPTDDAFGELPEELLGCLLLEENKSVLGDILLYHVASGKTLSSDLEDGMAITTLLSEEITVELPSNGGVFLNDATMVVTPDVEASNGVIHVIDQVLVPPSIDVGAFLETCTAESEDALVDIPSTAGAAGLFDTLVVALDAVDLVGALSEPNGPFTVFAPTDEAFGDLPDGILECLLENPKELSDVLLYHVAPGSALSTDLANGQKIPTLLEGADVTVRITEFDGVSINRASVIAADVLASNGVVHIIDEVLVPQRLDLDALCFQEKEDDSMAGMTEEKAVCSYLGVGRSAGQYLSGPTHTCLCTASGHWTNCRSSRRDRKTIEEVVVASNQFSTLETAVLKAGILGVLDGHGPFTLFAPTDRAFSKVPKKLLDFLLEDGNESELATVLQYHVYDGKVRSSSISNGKSRVPSLLGGSDTIAVEKTCLSAFDTCDDTYSIILNDSSYVVEADVDTANGIIHAIDEVLIPPSLQSAVENILAA